MIDHISRERVQQIRERAKRHHACSQIIEMSISPHFEMICDLLGYIDQLEAAHTDLLESCLEEHLKQMPQVPIVRGRVAGE